MEKIFKYIDDNFDSMLNELKTICGYRSVYDEPEELKKTSEFIINKMDNIGIEAKSYPIDSGNDIIHGVKEGSGSETILFYNHYDVVSETPIDQWNSPPYELSEKNGFLFGRGISDNKGPLMLRLHAVQSILAVYDSLPINVKFLFEGDEESGSMGMYDFIEKNKELFKNLFDSNLCLWENGRISNDGRPWARFGVRGNLSFTFNVKTSNKDVHARLSPIVPNAAARLVKALNSIVDDKGNVLIEGFYDDVMPLSDEDTKVLLDFSYDEDELKDSIGLKNYINDYSGEILKRTLYTKPSFSISGLESGKMYINKRSIVPCSATATGTFTLVPNQTPEKIRSLVIEHLNKNGFHDVTLSDEKGNTPIRTRTDSKYRFILENAAKKVYKKPLVKELTQLGAGPGYALRSVFPDLPIIAVGPANFSGSHHAPNENLKIEDYKNALKYTVALMYEMANYR